MLERNHHHPFPHYPHHLRPTVFTLVAPVRFSRLGLLGRFHLCEEGLRLRFPKLLALVRRQLRRARTHNRIRRRDVDLFGLIRLQPTLQHLPVILHALRLVISALFLRHS